MKTPNQEKAKDTLGSNYDGSTSPEGYERTKLSLPGKKDLVIAGLFLLCFVILASFFISIKMIYMLYSAYIIFILVASIFMWLEKPKPLENSIPMQWPKVTILIPSYNSIHTIFKCIKACKELDYQGQKNIVIIDDGSTDGSYELISKDPEITVLKKEKNSGKAAALNFGIRSTSSEIVCCVDSDTYPAKNSLEEAVKNFGNDPKVGASIVLVKTEPPKNLIQAVQEIEYWISFGYFFTGLSNIDSLYVTPGPMSLYRRSMLEDLGGYDEHNITEDMEIALRMQKRGWKIRYCKNTYVTTEVPATLKGLLRQRIRWYRGGLMNILKYNEMLLNAKYNNFGMFLLPIVLTSGLFGSMFLFWMLINNGQSLIDVLQPWITNFSATLSIGIGHFFIDLFLIDSSILLGIISLCMWAYFIYMGFSIAGEKLGKKHVLPLISLFTIYPVFMGVTYLIAYANEFSGKQYNW